MGEILAVRVSQEGCQGAVALAVAETGIRVTVHARRAQGTDSLGRALTALVAEAAESEVGLHGIYCRRLALTQEEPDALLQLGFHSLPVDRVVLIGCDGLHEHAHHIHAESVAAVLVIQNRLKQLFSGPDRILRNRVLTHIQSNQCENGSVNGIATRIIVQTCRQIGNDIALGILKGIVRRCILVQLAGIDSHGSQHHNRAVKIGHSHAGAGVQFPQSGMQIEVCRKRIRRSIAHDTSLGKAQIHPFPVIRCRSLITPYNVVPQTFHLRLIDVIPGWYQFYGHPVLIGNATLGNNRINHRIASTKIHGLSGFRIDTGKFRDFNRRCQFLQVGSIWYLKLYSSFVLIDLCLHASIGEGKHLVLLRDRRLCQHHRISAGIAVLCRHRVSQILSEGKAVRLLRQLRVLGDLNLRFYSGQTSSIRKSQGDLIPGYDSFLSINTVRKNITLGRIPGHSA